MKTQTKKANVSEAENIAPKKEVVFTKIVKAPKKKVTSKLTLAKRELVKLWNNENLKPSKICDFFYSDVAKETAQNYVDEVNNSFKTDYKISSLNKSLLNFGYIYEKNIVTLSNDKNKFIVKDKKQYFSPSYILDLLKRKAKYTKHTNPDFVKYTTERETTKICKMITDNARKVLIASLLAEHTNKA